MKESYSPQPSWWCLNTAFPNAHSAKKKKSSAAVWDDERQSGCTRGDKGGRVWVQVRPSNTQIHKTQSSLILSLSQTRAHTHARACVQLTCTCSGLQNQVVWDRLRTSLQWCYFSRCRLSEGSHRTPRLLKKKKHTHICHIYTSIASYKALNRCIKWTWLLWVWPLTTHPVSHTAPLENLKLMKQVSLSWNQ